jgi:hypothetical protein
MAFKPQFSNNAPVRKGLLKSKEAEIEKKSGEDLVTLEEERVYREGTVSIKDLLAPSAFNVESNFIKLGDIFCRTLFVVTYPRYISIGWSSPVLNLSITMDVGMFFIQSNQLLF